MLKALVTDSIVKLFSTYQTIAVANLSFLAWVQAKGGGLITYCLQYREPGKYAKI